MFFLLYGIHDCFTRAVNGVSQDRRFRYKKGTGPVGFGFIVNTTSISELFKPSFAVVSEKGDARTRFFSC